jgi:hypothetical protein
MTEAILTRRLIGESDDILVFFNAPILVEEHHWECEYGIQNGAFKSPHLGVAGGIDGVQSLLNAFEAVSLELERVASDYSWTGNQDGDHGFYSVIPYNYGYETYKELKEIIPDLAFRKMKEIKEKKKKC